MRAEHIKAECHLHAKVSGSEVSVSFALAVIIEH